jgi:DNA-3-methyladenine glycosylase I
MGLRVIDIGHIIRMNHPLFIALINKCKRGRRLKEKIRCAWANTDPLNMDYHDNEWGKPIYDDRRLFEFLILEGAQAGLSWITILKKRENYRARFDHFCPEKIARYNQAKIRVLLNDSGIIRNRLKIESAITNARAYLDVMEEWDHFSDYIWQFVEGKPIQNHWNNSKQVPTKTVVSDRISNDLKKRGFKFVGTTICYAFMQAVGMVNDHTMDCFCYAYDLS